MSYSNPAARLGVGTNNLAEGGEYPNLRISNFYPLLLSLYRSHWIIGKVVDVLAEDMLKDFPVISSEISPAKMEEFSKVIDMTGTPAKLLDALKWGRLFGGSVAVICIAGEEDLAEPLIVDDILPGTYKGLIALDRWSGVTPGMELVKDIENLPEFGLPAFYDCRLDEGGSVTTIHHSRILRFIGRDLPQWERQMQMYWGMSEVERVFDELRKRDYIN